MSSTFAIKSAIREPSAWPGGYPRYAVLSDGEMLCRDCACENYRAILYSTRHDLGDDWQCVGVDVLWEGTESCAHCGKDLESAYGDPDDY